MSNPIKPYLIVSALILLAAGHAFAGGRVVALVNGVAIEEADLTAAVNKKLPMASYHARVSKEKLREIRDQAMQSLIEEELLYQEAKRQNLAVNEAELARQISFMKSGYATEKDFDQQLSKAGLSRRQFRQRMRRRLLIQQLVQREVHDKVTVNDFDLLNYYATNKEKFVLPRQFQVRHILVSVDPGAMAAGWNAGLQKAQEVARRIRAGADFATVAKEVSDDSTSRDQGGSIGWFHQGQLLPELEEALGEMKIGEVSEPVATIYGFHILKLEATRPQKQLAFDEVNVESLKKKLLKKRTEERRQQFLASLEQRADIRIFDYF